MTIKPHLLKVVTVTLNAAFVAFLFVGLASGLALATPGSPDTFNSCAGANNCGPAPPPYTCYNLTCPADYMDGTSCWCVPMCNMFCQCVLAM